MKSKKIILNYLPPSTVYYPSPSLSILKSFLKHNNFDAEVKYWNFLLNPIIQKNLDDEVISDNLIRLMPFYHYLSEELQDDESKNKILAYLISTAPQYIQGDINHLEDYLLEIRKKIQIIINDELAKTDLNNTLLFGISYKLFQWIPGIILAGEVKKRCPELKIVIGGFGNKEAALELMDACKHFDFAIWGEGEYPLLQLCEQTKNKSNSFDKIARLIYREKDKIKIASTSRSKFLDFKNYIFPDYDDYMPYYPALKKKLLFFPINSIRSCHWKKCNFCNYNHGYKYRERSPESIVEEVKYVSKKYGHKKFIFVDNDIIGTSIGRFEKLLDLLIKAQKEADNSYYFWCEMIPHMSMNERIINKMALARFGEVFVGYEGISDSILKKMNKSNDFALNILMVKSALKNDIHLRANLIKGIPDETKEDVLESIENLYYLRFFFHNNKYNHSHIHGFFTLYKEANYYKTISIEEIRQYNSNPFPYYLPNTLIKFFFTLFGFYKGKIDNAYEWQAFTKAESYYIKNEFHYSITKKGKKIIYKEFLNRKKIQEIEFFEPEYIDTLLEANDKVCSFKDIHNRLLKKYPGILKERLKEILDNLNETFLIYHNDDYSRIISIIDINKK